MAINLERFISNMCKNSCQAFYDSYVEANVKFRSKLGMKQVIIRRQLGKCCDWCASLAGIYNASNAPKNIYQRHRDCNCLVTYKTERGYQDVWSKKEFDSQRKARIDRANELEIRNNELTTGARILSTGALDPTSLRARRHAKRYYGLVRKMNTDVKRISENTKIPQRDIESVKKYLFIDSHDLGENGIRRFFEDYNIAESWQRLIQGNYQEHDLLLLKHELYELELVEQGMEQSVAHTKASVLYNYSEGVDRYNASVIKHRTKR